MVLFAANGGQADKEVLEAMNGYKEATIQNDGAVLDKLLSSDLTYVHSGGQLETKSDVIKAITCGKTIVERIDFTGTTVRFYGNTALVKCNVDL